MQNINDVGCYKYGETKKETFLCNHCEENKDYENFSFLYWSTNQDGDDVAQRVCNDCSPTVKTDLGGYFKR